MKRGLKWTPEDLVYLTINFPSKPITDLMRYLGRSEDAVRLKASRLGLSRVFFTAGDAEAMNCYGKDFGENCITRCPGHDGCLDKYLELIKLDGSIILGQNKLTVLDKIERDQLFQALKVLRTAMNVKKEID